MVEGGEEAIDPRSFEEELCATGWEGGTAVRDNVGSVSFSGYCDMEGVFQDLLYIQERLNQGWCPSDELFT